MIPQATILAVQLTRQQVNSAMPHAPVLTDAPRPRLRTRTARALRRAADRLDT
ncbi:hypothetical protein GCM10009557_51340 [Virgisporangium ochraceum]|jgi:hypothetical protein|uniref:Uncharacterized protein n=1 Tax=Virgisporangium ochraceum TaxID=65505 RepID=A0A8J4E8B9_9ACTN|nr:hypothetical protein [Virgisporangium ochraceum]GIJ66010.1 hypothetical protein Voc01_009270 [Virgisporangium ochraceum]